jgi:antitoxin (DNA-binding transcriptional repressor) of toxin-antitoxin stability system
MKTVGIHGADLKSCIQDAQHESIVLTRNGKPVALLVGVEGMDLEQIELGHSDKFWTLMRQRRGQKTLSRAELEKRITDVEDSQG